MIIITLHSKVKRACFLLFVFLIYHLELENFPETRSFSANEIH